MSTVYDLEINNENLHDNIIKIAHDLKPEWRNYHLDDIKIKDLNGGVTNRLLSCYLSKNGFNTPDTLLFRVYGKNTEQFISREDEIKTMKLMKKINLGPDFYARFRNGICYEFLPGEVVDIKLVNDENVYTKIAQGIANLHIVNFNGFIRESDLEAGQTPFIFRKTREILDLVKQDYKSNMPQMTDEYLKVIPSKDQLKNELDYLQKYFQKYTHENESLIVFSHNDLLLGNIIFNEKTNNLKFIDYEYADLNYQAYDIANHFNEFSGVEEPDYSLFPSKDYQLKWLRIYLETFYAKINKYYTKQSDEPVLIDDQRVNQFYDEVNKFTLTSHLMWAIWSLVQAQNSELDFDFVKYSKIRFDEYFKRKAELLN